MATYNGQTWLNEQVTSIVEQDGVKILIAVSDDCSTDSSREILESWNSTGKLFVLPLLSNRLGTANKNFLRLIKDCPIGDSSYIALSDQDDIWLKGKIIRAIRHLEEKNADVYSSSVIALWPDGNRTLVEKSFPLQRFDYLFESPGPGCTFVMRRQAFLSMRDWVVDNYALLNDVRVHDWLIYAFARKQGWAWFIDAEPTMLYRQHNTNEIGANSGISAAIKRLRQILTGEYREDVLRIAHAVGATSWVVQALERFTLSDRLRLMLSARQFRRNPLHSLVLAFFFLLMPSGRNCSKAL